MYKASKRHLTVSVGALAVAILFSLPAIPVRSVVAPEGQNGYAQIRKPFPGGAG